MKDLECENEKLEHQIKQLQKELVKTGTVEEQVITEIVTRENMKNEYDTILGTMRQKQALLLREKEDNKSFFEKKIEDLNRASQELQEREARAQQEIREWKGGLTRQGGDAGAAGGRQESGAEGGGDSVRKADSGDPAELRGLSGELQKQLQNPVGGDPRGQREVQRRG